MNLLVAVQVDEQQVALLVRSPLVLRFPMVDMQLFSVEE
jgi:hypothetical protein